MNFVANHLRKVRRAGAQLPVHMVRSCVPKKSRVQKDIK